VPRGKRPASEGDTEEEPSARLERVHPQELDRLVGIEEDPVVDALRDRTSEGISIVTRRRGLVTGNHLDTYTTPAWTRWSGTVGSIVRNLPEEGWEKGIGPGIIDKKIMGPNDSNFMLMGLAKMDPGVKSPPHRHRYTQIFYFLEGHGQVIADGQAYDVSA